MRSRATVSLILFAVAAAAAAPPAAAGTGFEDLYEEYRSTGVIRGCAYSQEDLQRGLAETPADVRAYDPGFGDALNAALEQRAASCRSVASLAADAARGAATAPDGSPGPARPAGPAFAAVSASGGSGGGPQVALLAIAALAGVAAVALAAGFPARRQPGD